MESVEEQRSIRASTPGTDLRTLAKTMFRELIHAGYQARDVITFATELLDFVLSSLRREPPDATARGAPGAPDEEGK